MSMGIPGKYLMEEIVREFLKYWGKLKRYEVDLGYLIIIIEKKIFEE